MEQDVDVYTLAVAAILKKAQQQPGQPSYTQLAELTGLSRPTIERVLNGRRDISLLYLREICLALGLDITKVVDDAEDAVGGNT